jgi:hypothetical protein
MIIPPLLGKLLMATVELLILAMLIVLTWKKKGIVDFRLVLSAYAQNYAH